MNNEVFRIFVEKKPAFAIEARHLLQALKNDLGLARLRGLRVVHRYDVEGIDRQAYERAVFSVFAEAPVDYVYREELPLLEGEVCLASEYLPGQFDQRADSAAQCLQIITQKERPLIRYARLLCLSGRLDESDLQKLKKYCINPVDSREAALVKPPALSAQTSPPPPVATLRGFTEMTEDGLRSLMRELGLAMSFEDLLFCRGYFRDGEKRDPSLTEIKVIDTYWSDHCRHTTFLTGITEVKIDEGPFSAPLAATYKRYTEAKEAYYGAGKRDACLMDIATLAMKELRKEGLLNDLDASEEINACSIKVEIEVNGQKEPWLVMFKNETHNHPTEIEPFGGAATCLGGAIRDPLSGRAYVYQAMRITGSGDPRADISTTLPGKLAQRKITREAARGYSSYGNQIGLATGQVAELYHEGFIAKRMEVGAVIAAAPAKNVRR
ncbi:MAG: phosphoribosylformylglycinamidine synthase, partial [Clostridiales bacterium]|nr:phosphoribosylformylglycinamidine synthase [Clostridiales bacterium]